MINEGQAAPDFICDSSNGSQSPRHLAEDYTRLTGTDPTPCSPNSKP